MRIGFVGTGTMGRPIAECLVAAGHRLTVYDRNPQAMSPLLGHGATAAADNPAEAAYNAEVVFTSLPGPSEVEAAALDPETGILAGLRKGGAYIDLTTNAPATVRRIAEAAGKRDIAFLDAPVSGRPPSMTVMVGGRENDFAHCKPLFAAIAANVFYVGPSGAGATAKLVTQYLGYTGFVAALEGMLIAAKAGIDLATLARIVPLSAGQSRTFGNIPRGVLPGTFAAGGTLDIVAKDMALACALARDVGAPATLGALASDVYARAQAQGWGGEGFPVIARVLEAMAGVELRAGPKP
ncbi:MAG: NAD(P)-dependent oxidoreductase [Alphaproteobacteria bacterium]|nr:NAD(P)-dependent oxidoreductase [Alphaproteobacteria bacterium]